MTIETMPWVNVSISGCSEARALGFDDAMLGRMTVRVAEFLLFRGCRLVFGHDWREDGIMRAVASVAERAAAGGSLGDAVRRTPETRLFNLVPTGSGVLSRAALDAREAARDPSRDGTGGVLEVRALREYVETRDVSADLPSQWHTDRMCELWVLRHELTELLAPGLRICLGGSTSGYEGFYAGIAEEAWMALARSSPLYLIGGFGGAAADVIKALGGNAGPRPQRPNDSRTLEAPSVDVDDRRRQVASRVGIPTTGLEKPLRELGLQRLADANGLTLDENASLFHCTDIEEALHWVWTGWTRIQAEPEVR